MASPPKRQKLTEFAEIYSHPIGYTTGVHHDEIAYDVPYKSGLTPVNLGAGFTEQDRERAVALEGYQMSRLENFRTSELATFEALPHLIKDVKDEDFSNIPLHPAFAKHKWQRPLPANVPRVPLGLGRPGYWEAANPVAWAHILPALKLASLYLSNDYYWPWWDALLMGKMEPIHENEIPPDKQEVKLWRFRRRAPQVANTPDQRRRVRAKFRDLASEIEFGFYCGHWDTYGNVSSKPYGNALYGYTLGSTSYQTCKIWLTAEFFEPCLNSKITVAERMVWRHLQAMTLLHEFAHAVGAEDVEQHPATYDASISLDEPYFEEERTRELGYSMEQNIFGGTAKPINANNGSNAFPAGGIFQYDNQGPVADRGPTSGQPILLPLPDDWTTMIYFPVPVQHFINLHQMDYWNVYTKTKGHKALYMGPRLIGNFAYDDPPAGVISTCSSGYGRQTFLQAALRRDIVIDGYMTEEEKKVALITNTQQEQARRIRATLDMTNAGRQAFETGTDPLPPLPDDFGVPPIPHVEFTYPEYDPPCPRFEYIRDYLTSHRASLSMDTLYFDIAEHQLLEYIIRDGFSDLQPDEWRSFLRKCEGEGTLFYWKEIGLPPASTYGLVGRNPNGWPTDQLPPPQLAPLQAQNDFDTHFLIGLDKIENNHYTADWWYDCDKEILRAIANEGSLRPLSRLEFDHGFAKQRAPDQDINWMLGPEGIIRRKPW